MGTLKIESNERAHDGDVVGEAQGFGCFFGSDVPSKELGLGVDCVENAFLLNEFHDHYIRLQLYKLVIHNLVSTCWAISHWHLSSTLHSPPSVGENMCRPTNRLSSCLSMYFCLTKIIIELGVAVLLAYVAILSQTRRFKPVR